MNTSRVVPWTGPRARTPLLSSLRHLGRCVRALVSSAPRDTVLLMAGCAVYALVCVLLGRIVDAPFVVPAERISPALGLPAAVPVGVAGAGYVALQIARRTVD